MHPAVQENTIPTLGLAISPQHAEINEHDYDFSIQIQEILNNNNLSEEERVREVLNIPNREMDSYLAFIGLNTNSFITVVRNLVNEGDFAKAKELLDSLSQLSSLDITNPIVLDKYIAILELVGMKTFRFGLNWHKLTFFDEQTKTNYPSTKGINAYCEIISKLKANGIEPIITYSHFDTLGMDITESEFEDFFKYLLEFTLPQLINAGAKKFIPFNESSVHAGSTSTGYWGYKESKLELNPLESLADGYNQFSDYKNDLAALLRLNNIFYHVAHEIDPDVEIILNMNVTQILFGTKDSFLRNMVAKPIGRGIENIHLNQFLAQDESGQTPALFDKVSIHPYHIVNGAAFTTFSGLMQLIPDIFFRRKLPDYKRVTKLSGQHIDPRLNDQEKVRRGTNGQILSPEINIELIIEICKRYGIKEIIITETGLDSRGDNPEGIELKKWYYESFIKAIPKLAEAGIRVTSALFWSMLRNYEITGQHGGGMSSFDFGALGTPLTVSEFKKELTGLLSENSDQDVDSIVKAIFLNGNVPIKFYPGMISFFRDLNGVTSGSLENFFKKFLQTGESKEDLICAILQLVYLLDLIKEEETNSQMLLSELYNIFLDIQSKIAEMGITYLNIDKIKNKFANMVDGEF